MSIQQDEVRDCFLAGSETWPGLAHEWWGDWQWRWGSGYTSRANSVLVLGAPDRPLADAIDAVEARYREHGLPALFQVPRACDEELQSFTAMRPTAPALEEQLEARGYSPVTPTRVMVAERSAGPHDLPDGVTLAWTAAPSEGWIELSSTRFHENPAALAVTTACRADYGTLLRDEAPVGRVRVANARGRSTISDLLVVPGERGRGLGRALLRAAQSHGGGKGLLQVEDDNANALALYRRDGWSTVAAYRYLRQA